MIKQYFNWWWKLEEVNQKGKGLKKIKKKKLDNERVAKEKK